MTDDLPPDRRSETPDEAAIFRLLLPVDAAASSAEPTIEFAGSRWLLSEGSELPARDEAPDYTCVSYAWGEGRTPHPMDPERSMSDRTLAVVETVVRSAPQRALWVDAFCVPAEGAERVACLRRMGEIYAGSSAVAVVLSERSGVVLEQIRASDTVDEAALLALAEDEWVSRAWTYQEMVNGNGVTFYSEGAPGAYADGDEMLRNLTYAIDRYKKTQACDTFEMRARFPRLDSLEELMVDWKMARYLERSAFAVMSGMHGRGSANPDDTIYAMIGAIGAPRVEASSLLGPGPAEYFMRACETKEDFSFIYCTAPRSELPGKLWRPAAGMNFSSVFPWHSWGDRQAGGLHESHLQLDGMRSLTPGAVSSKALEFIDTWQHVSADAPALVEIPDRILHNLRLAGFQGSGDYLETEDGYVFSSLPLAPADELFVAVSTGIRMSLGAPALLLERGPGAIHGFHGVGLFVGVVPKEGETICVA